MAELSIPKVNVNVGVYIVSLIAIGFGERYGLFTLHLLGLISGISSFISIVWVLPAYTREYIRRKNKAAR